MFHQPNINVASTSTKHMHSVNTKVNTTSTKKQGINTLSRYNYSIYFSLMSKINTTSTQNCNVNKRSTLLQYQSAVPWGRHTASMIYLRYET